jgi:hypothetical protein
VARSTATTGGPPLSTIREGPGAQTERQSGRRDGALRSPRRRGSSPSLTRFSRGHHDHLFGHHDRPLCLPRGRPGTPKGADGVTLPDAYRSSASGDAPLMRH